MLREISQTEQRKALYDLTYYVESKEKREEKPTPLKLL